MGFGWDEVRVRGWGGGVMHVQSLLNVRCEGLSRMLCSRRLVKFRSANSRTEVVVSMQVGECLLGGQGVGHLARRVDEQIVRATQVHEPLLAVNLVLAESIAL